MPDQGGLQPGQGGPQPGHGGGVLFDRGSTGAHLQQDRKKINLYRYNQLQKP
jgi:hypothetical protein